MGKLTGKVAVVTGASKGIGAGIARELAAAGAAVVVNYATAKEGADKVVADIAAKGGKAVAIQADVAKEGDVERLFAEARRTFGPIDVLVNNAGVYRFGSIEEFTEAEYRRQFDTNVLGLLFATREAVKQFNPAGGSIINISSIAPSVALPGTAIYTATKGAVDSITRVLSKELAPKKIRVNAIGPGGVETEGLHAMGIVGTDFEKEMTAQVPLGRLGQPEDIGPVALFLASEDAGWVTGEILFASGGHR
ncbi:oxidoreductase [Aliidongia dinghuensis]|uniref:Oxidoreductase n=1 Tax=Aliidongia dinghuensis TaxID=1867774 RepID=A0A8J3E631_9PROT|nr:glucose 1-dehydrogenase [Aliidongia dinghuensis]GGF26392.1 oxidoreductase [Aliidongia dinghuensis]